MQFLTKFEKRIPRLPQKYYFRPRNVIVNLIFASRILFLPEMVSGRVPPIKLPAGTNFPLCTPKNETKFRGTKIDLKTCFLGPFWVFEGKSGVHFAKKSKNVKSHHSQYKNNLID